MSLLTRIFGEPKQRHIFNDEEREEAQIERLKKSIREQRLRYLRERLERLKQMQEERKLEQDVVDAEDDLEPDDSGPDDENDEEDPDKLIIGMLGSLMAPKQPLVQPVESQSSRLHLSDTAIKEYLSRVPLVMRAKLRKMSDAELIEQARAYAPDLLERCDEDTIARAIRMIKA